MKNNLSILIFVVAVGFLQACGSGDKSVEETVAETSLTTDSTEQLAIERHAKLESERALMAENRRIAFEKIAAETPFYTDGAGKIVYNKADQAPAYRGGDQAMKDYLKMNLTYPETAKKEGIEGTVFVDFIVESSGDVHEVMVTNSPTEQVDQRFRTEAIRVVSEMPSWIPGQQNGKDVAVKFSIPITFELI